MAMAATHEREGGTAVPRILDVCQDLKALSAALDRAPHALAVELAALAARREYLNLEKWLQARAAASGALVGVLQPGVVTGDDAGAPTPGAPKLAVETMAIFFKTLHAGAGGLPRTRAGLQGAAAARAHPTPAAAAASPGGAPGAVPAAAARAAAARAGPRAVLSADVEAEANAFQRLYWGRGRRSRRRCWPVPRVRDAAAGLFGCMVHACSTSTASSPATDKELRVTAVLFGRLIDPQRWREHAGRRAALRLDALRKPFGTKMFAFGWRRWSSSSRGCRRPVCQHLAAVPHLVKAHPDSPRCFRAERRGRGSAGTSPRWPTAGARRRRRRREPGRGRRGRAPPRRRHHARAARAPGRAREARTAAGCSTRSPCRR